MKYVLIIHEVAAYPDWKRVFEDAAPMRKAAGEVSYQLLHRDSAENVVVHVSHWTSLDAAREFFESSELVERRRRASVIAPEFLYLEQVEAGLLWRISLSTSTPAQTELQPTIRRRSRRDLGAG